MLVKITNKCGMGCGHCMEGSTVAGEHMSKEIFGKALDLTARLEAFAWKAGIPPLIFLSGGECTEHPDILWCIEEVYRRGYYPMLITNGMWLDDPDLRAAILRPEWPRLLIQLTNDARFYPRKPADIPNDPRITVIPSLTHMIPLGRFKNKRAPATTPFARSPTSFNLRSATRAFGDVRVALVGHRLRAMQGRSGNCSPSISHDGTIAAGETNSCYSIGNVDSTPDQVTRALIEMTCNRCGLVDNLTQEQKFAIGEARIVAP
jgi:hypothetical protein